MKETEKVLKQLNKFILNHVEDYDSVDEAVLKHSRSFPTRPVSRAKRS